MDLVFKGAVAVASLGLCRMYLNYICWTWSNFPGVLEGNSGKTW